MRFKLTQIQVNLKFYKHSATSVHVHVLHIELLKHIHCNFKHCIEVSVMQQFHGNFQRTNMGSGFINGSLTFTTCTPNPDPT